MIRCLILDILAVFVIHQAPANKRGGEVGWLAALATVDEKCRRPMFFVVHLRDIFSTLRSLLDHRPNPRQPFGGQIALCVQSLSRFKHFPYMG